MDETNTEGNLFYQGKWEVDEELTKKLHLESIKKQSGDDLENGSIPKTTYKLGDRVEVNWRDSHITYRGTVNHIDRDQHLVRFDDGDSESGVPARRLRPAFDTSQRPEPLGEWSPDNIRQSVPEVCEQLEINVFFHTRGAIYFITENKIAIEKNGSGKWVSYESIEATNSSVTIAKSDGDVNVISRTENGIAMPISMNGASPFQIQLKKVSKGTRAFS